MPSAAPPRLTAHHGSVGGLVLGQRQHRLLFDLVVKVRVVLDRAQQQRVLLRTGEPAKNRPGLNVLGPLRL